MTPKPIAVTSLELRRGTGKNTAVADAMVLDDDGSPVAAPAGSNFVWNGTKLSVTAQF